MSATNPVSGVAIRAARWSATHPGRAIAGWLAFVAMAVGLAVAIPTVEADGADYWQGESGRASELIHEAELGRAPAEMVMITSAEPEAPETAAAADEIASAMAALDGVDEVAPGEWNEARTSMLVVIQFARGHDDVAPLQAVTERVATAYPELQIAQTGDESIDLGIDERVKKDLRAAEGISIPVTLVLMLIAFGALIAAGLPVLLAIGSVAATIGITAPLSHLIHAETVVASMIVLIGMAVGVDYSLFYLKREREERAKGRSTLEAVEIAAETSGHSIIISGGAVIASMTGLFVVGGATFNSLAASSILVVAIAVLGSITVLPAMMVKLGRWVDRPRVPLLWRLNARIGKGGISSRVLGPVVRRPVLALVASGLVIGVLSVPALGMKLHTSSLETLPASIPAVETIRAVQREFPGEGPVVQVVATGDREPVAAALAGLEEAALARDEFVPVGGESTRFSADGGTAVLSLAMPFEESSDEVGEAVTLLRDSLVPSHLTADGVAEHAVGGGSAQAVDVLDRMNTYLPIVVGFVLMLTMLMMGFSFRSVPIALVSTVLNLASVGVAFGLITLVFQHGYGEGLLDFASAGHVIDWIPMFVLVVLVGLSLDYHVFVLSRIREYVRAGVPSRQAVERGINDTAGVVTSAAAVMVSVFAIFATLSMMEMKMLGVGLSAAILIDATLVRLVALPAALVLLGDRAWWPNRPSGAADVAAVVAPAARQPAPVEVGAGS